MAYIHIDTDLVRAWLTQECGKRGVTDEQCDKIIDYVANDVISSAFDLVEGGYGDLFGEE